MSITLIAYLATLPQVSAKVASDVDFYCNHAQAQEYILACSMDTSSIQSLVLTKDEWRALLSVKGVLKKERRSDQRKAHDGKKAKFHYRLNTKAIREALYPFENDHGKIRRLVRGIHWLSKAQWEQACLDFCARFNCRLELEPEDEEDDSKVYTHGDVIEFLTWCELGENPANWSKNCRNYKRGTDCGIYEIKSACSWFAPSAVWIGKNQNI